MQNSPRHLIRREPRKLEGVLVLWRLFGPDVALSDSRHGSAVNRPARPASAFGLV